MRPGIQGQPGSEPAFASVSLTRLFIDLQLRFMAGNMEAWRGAVIGPVTSSQYVMEWTPALPVPIRAPL